MTNFLKILISLLLISCLNSCGVSNANGNAKTINKELNSKYKASRNKIIGKLTPSEYTEMKILLEKELGVTISGQKSILINYDQKAPNCILLASSESSVVHILKNRVKISSEISQKYNAIDFFVYESNSYFADLHANDVFFKVDSGFFFNNIFTLHENCQAFYILKPNGDFLKYYGEDYYSEVKEFLEKK